jgi:hypothetical protein
VVEEVECMHGLQPRTCVSCKTRARKFRADGSRAKGTRTIRARYAGRCTHCGKWWEPGEWILTQAKYARPRWMHESCWLETPATEHRLEEDRFGELAQSLKTPPIYVTMKDREWVNEDVEEEEDDDA